MHASQIIDRFGGEAVLGSALGVGKSSVAYWVKTGVVPAKWHARLIELAKQRGVPLTREELADSGLQAPAQHAVFREIAGIGMGVLPDGQAFLTGPSLARLCGVADDDFPGDRPVVPFARGDELLQVHADEVCLAVLQSHAAGSERARHNHRLLAGDGLRELVLVQTAYDPNHRLALRWKQFHEQASRSYDAMQPGRFGVFKEMADLVIALGQAGVQLSSTVVPDVSVGLAWSARWKGSNLEAVYGPRSRHPHDDAELFGHAIAQVPEPWRYPATALDEFRRWLYNVFIGPSRFQRFGGMSARDKALPVSFSRLDL